jgi:phosphoesterase RecJ-like protein
MFVIFVLTKYKQFEKTYKMKHIESFETNLDNSLKQISNFLKEYSKFVIIIHQNPDGDAIGSATAIANLLHQLEKSVTIMVDNQLPDNLKFLKGFEEIIVYSSNPAPEIIREAEVILIMDLNDSNRMSSIEQEYLESKAIKLLIDHHINPKLEVEVMAVDTEATSTGELTWKLLRDNFRHYINKEIAESCYVAIMTDTGNFRYDRTDIEIFRIAAEIISYGADPVKLYNDVYNTFSIKAAKLLGKALAGIETYYDDRMCVMTVSRDDYRNYSCTNDDTEGFVDYTLMLDGVTVGILIKEDLEKDIIKISLRSKGEYHVRELGVHFNGGGHKHASGARVEAGNVEEVKSELIRLAGEMIFRDL